MAVMEFSLIGGTACLDFANTVWGRGTDRHSDRIQSYDDLLDWAEAARLFERRALTALRRQAAAQVGAAKRVVRKALKVRSTIYQIFRRVATHSPIDGSVLDALNSDLQHASRHRGIWGDGGGFTWKWDADGNLDAVLWPIVHSAGSLLTSKPLNRVRQCDDEDCKWLFVDRTRNGCRRWCDSATCGNRSRVRSHYWRMRD